MQNEHNETALKEITYNIEENGKLEEKSTKPNYFLYFIAATTNLISFSIGCTTLWITPIISKIDGTRGLDDSPFDRPITSTEIAILAGLVPGGGTIGNLITGKIISKFGRKRPLVYYGCLLLCSYSITGVFTNLYLFYLARFMAGFVVGCGFPTLPVYLTEIAEVHNRGALGCSMAICVALGMNFAVIIGPYLSVSMFSIVLMCPLLIFVPTFAFLSPETPLYLASINDSKNLASSLNKLRNKSNSEIAEEMTQLLEASQQNKDKGNLQDLYKNRLTRKSFTICLTLCIFQQGIGYGCITSYLPIIFDAVKAQLASEISVMVVGSCQLVGMLLSLFIVDKAGRRILLLVSTSGICLSLATLGGYFFLLNYSFEMSGVSWLPLLTLASFTIFYGIGLGPVAWVVSAEILPAKIKSIAMGLIGFTSFTVAFSTLVTFPSIIKHLGFSNCFFIFAFIAFCAGIFIYFIIPETKGKNFQEIQKMLSRS